MLKKQAIAIFLQGQDSQVLEVSAGEVIVSNDLDLAFASLTDLDAVAEVVGSAFNLDALLEELLKSRCVEDLVASRLLRIDDEL